MNNYFAQHPHSWAVIGGGLSLWAEQQLSALAPILSALAPFLFGVAAVITALKSKPRS